MSMTGPDVIPCPNHPDLECVRIGSPAHGGHSVQPPPEPNDGERPEGTDSPEWARLCPEGYVPRRLRRPPYELDGKRIRPVSG
jgi:hypothetical protein